jgi:DNA-binding MarR family transcriptional regulator
MSTSAMRQDGSAAYRRYLSAVVLHGLASAEAAGLNATDMYALNLLELSGPMTASGLASQSGLTTGATTRLIDRLERGGHVRRRADPGDRRKVIIEPASAEADPAAGASPGIDAAVAAARRRVGEIFQGFSPEQLATLFQYFDKAAGAFLEATRDLQATRAAPAGAS